MRHKRIQKFSSGWVGVLVGSLPAVLRIPIPSKQVKAVQPCLVNVLISVAFRWRANDPANMPMGSI